ncbi:SGNH/GDSL hydrolase family protein [Actinomadura rupiterrae]|uniref:SGNH/GDSL hydrolase family protein n=1 Tax=Actinomadura rupiterrae TaxID=559627 RepID=UPI0020A2940A|nr:SGNH/GDSL hydrolase family protein [Actinomadura rupiterrae]MCP2341770.1 lysophospholipase L1-like esterase [Actinomadura rupiterrae]
MPLTSRPWLRRSLVTLVPAALAALALAPAARAAAPAYVALGDSMASGPLIPDITGPVACGRSTHNYAHVLASTLGVAGLNDVTCSGAATRHMTEPQNLSVLGQPAGTAPPQFDALTADTRLVTLTIGGNDAGLVGVAQTCVNLLPTGTPCKTKYTQGGVDQVAQRIDAFEPKLAAVLDGIRQRSPQARVAVTGYGLYIKPGGCWPTVPVLPADADWLQGSVARMNGVIARQAAAHGMAYIDLVTPSAGHDACQAPAAKWLEGYVPTSAAAPLHPNRTGEENYARIIAGQLQAAR